jgi:hypothetical protein
MWSNQAKSNLVECIYISFLFPYRYSVQDVLLHTTIPHRARCDLYFTINKSSNGSINHIIISHYITAAASPPPCSTPPWQPSGQQPFPLPLPLPQTPPAGSTWPLPSRYQRNTWRPSPRHSTPATAVRASVAPPAAAALAVVLVVEEEGHEGGRRGARAGRCPLCFAAHRPHAGGGGPPRGALVPTAVVRGASPGRAREGRRRRRAGPAGAGLGGARRCHCHCRCRCLARGAPKQRARPGCEARGQPPGW